MATNKDTNVFFGAWERTSKRTKRALRIILSILLFTGLSLGLCFLRFNMPLAPDFLSGDFSVFFELIAAIAYGPITGGVICLLKFALHTVIVPTAWISDVANFFVEEAFIITVSLFYYNVSFNKKERNKQGKKRQFRRKRIILGSLVGIIPALIIQFFINRDFVFPKLDWYYRYSGYSKAEIIEKYAASIAAISKHLPDAIAAYVPEITEIWQGILIFNLPFTFAKLIIVALVTALIYPLISPYLHFRKKTK